MPAAEQPRREGAQHAQGDPGRTAPSAPRLIRHLRSDLSIRMTEASGRTAVTVRGDIDLDCADTFYQALAACLADTPEGVDVDLAEVAFFDCAGLNALLRARALARSAGAELDVTAISPAVARLLDLTRRSQALPLVVPPSPMRR